MPMKIVFSIILIFLLNNIYPLENIFPTITDLNTQDLGFRQYLSDVEIARRRIVNLERTDENITTIVQTLTIYAYTPKREDDLLSLSARCNIPYSTIATINRISRQRSFDNRRTLLLPSIPGLFVPENPDSDLEMLLASSRNSYEGIRITISVNGNREIFRFIPGGDFTSTERVFFFNEGFRYPLRNFRLTSSFGPRINPITGNLRNHAGLDLAAPLGTEVYSAKEGVVAEIGNDPIYGIYIIVNHSDGWSSLYGHLSKVETVLRRRVEAGALIGRVGSTGQSTGPHLHFELRRNGRALDPARHLF